MKCPPFIPNGTSHTSLSGNRSGPTWAGNTAVKDLCWVTLTFDVMAIRQRQAAVTRLPTGCGQCTLIARRKTDSVVDISHGAVTTSSLQVLFLVLDGATVALQAWRCQEVPAERADCRSSREEVTLTPTSGRRQQRDLPPSGTQQAAP